MVTRSIAEKAVSKFKDDYCNPLLPTVLIDLKNSVIGCADVHQKQTIKNVSLFAFKRLDG